MKEKVGGWDSWSLNFEFRLLITVYWLLTTPSHQTEYDSKLIDLRRVARVTAGGKRFNFRATVVVGNHNGRVGLGVAKGADTAAAIEKATRAAKKKAIQISSIRFAFLLCSSLFYIFQPTPMSQDSQKSIMARAFRHYTEITSRVLAATVGTIALLGTPAYFLDKWLGTSPWI